MTDQSLVEKVFSPGSRVILEYVDLENAARNCGTRIEDIEGAYLVLQTPIIDNLPVVFRESQELTLRRLDDQKKEAYVTNVFVIDIRQGKIPLLVCSRPHKINRTSLRRFSRFGVDLPLLYSGSDTGGDGYLCDLSLSGCYAMMKPNPKVNSDTVLSLSFTIPGETDVVVEGRVIRTDSINGKDDIGVAIEFKGLDSALQELLYNYIFQLQLTADGILGSSPRDE